MKNSYVQTVVVFALILSAITQVKSQQLIDGLLVETYYVADSQDAASLNNNGLLEGMVTYRVFLDLAPGVSVTSIFGNADHELRIQSTEPFYNALPGGGQTFGHNINAAAIPAFSTVLLDSYLSFSSSSTVNHAIPKSEDPDGSISPSGFGPEMILTNFTPEMGSPLTETDGLIPLDPGQTSTDPGVTNSSVFARDSLAAVFGTTTDRPLFSSDTVIFGNDFIDEVRFSVNGELGRGEENFFLVGQFTTLGELKLSLNLTLETQDDETFTVVADGVNLQDGEIVSPFLRFPAQCGCTDPDFVEYNAAASCDDGSCANLVVIGCNDEKACNYNPEVNIEAAGLEDLCCYGPDDCGELDISLACPDFVKSLIAERSGTVFFPNPSSGRFFMRLNQNETFELSIYSSDARLIFEKTFYDVGFDWIDISGYSNGVYLVQLTFSDGSVSLEKILVRN